MRMFYFILFSITMHEIGSNESSWIFDRYLLLNIISFHWMQNIQYSYFAHYKRKTKLFRRKTNFLSKHLLFYLLPIPLLHFTLIQLYAMLALSFFVLSYSLLFADPLISLYLMYWFDWFSLLEEKESKMLMQSVAIATNAVTFSPLCNTFLWKLQYSELW